MTRLWILGGVVLALVGGGLLGGADDDNLGADVIKLADQVEKKDANAKKNAEKLAEKADLEDIMELFKPKGKGKGLMGIEQKIQGLDKKAPPANFDAKEVARAAYIVAAISTIIPDKVPPKEKKKLKEWQKFTDEMNKAAIELAETVKENNPNPTKVQKAAQKLNNVCINCHDEFR